MTRINAIRLLVAAIYGGASLRSQEKETEKQEGKEKEKRFVGGSEADPEEMILFGDSVGTVSDRLITISGPKCENPYNMILDLRDPLDACGYGLAGIDVRFGSQTKTITAQDIWNAL